VNPWRSTCVQELPAHRGQLPCDAEMAVDSKTRGYLHAVPTMLVQSWHAPMHLAVCLSLCRGKTSCSMPRLRVALPMCLAPDCLQRCTVTQCSLHSWPSRSLEARFNGVLTIAPITRPSLVQNHCMGEAEQRSASLLLGWHQPTYLSPCRTGPPTFPEPPSVRRAPGRHRPRSGPASSRQSPGGKPWRRLLAPADGHGCRRRSR
jgi:hypothetical protein